MTTYVLTVDVHDLEPTGPVPATAEVRLWRALPDASAAQVVSTRQQTLKVGAGPATVTLTAGVAYWAEFTGVRGWETPFLFSGTTDTSIAERWRNGQLDPVSLASLPTYPTIAAQIAAQAASDAATYPALDGSNRLAVGGTEITPAQVGADPAGAAAAITLAGLGGITPAAVDTKVSTAISGLVNGASAALDTLSEIDAQMAADEGSAAALAVLVAQKADAATIASQLLLAWTLAQAFTVTSATRDANEAITTASVVWPDAATGTFTTDTASTAFPGAIDAYHVTHVLGGVTKTVTQTAVTRDAGGAVTAQPALTVA